MRKDYSREGLPSLIQTKNVEETISTVAAEPAVVVAEPAVVEELVVVEPLVKDILT